MLKENISKILLDFDPISLLEMDRVKLMNRIDTKFAFSASQLIQILPDLAENYKILEIEGTRLPFYESLYFDDDDFGFFKDHHNGRTNRFKVRFRKYVESNLIFLEIKHKFKGRTNKSRIKVENFNQTLDGNELKFVRKVLNHDKNLQPVMWNSFNRLTLVHKQLNERLTLDLNLTFKWENELHNFDNLIIAELKQEVMNRNSTFFQLMKTRCIRPYRLSKYCIGSIQLYGKDGLKFNRFKKKLLTLKKINTNAA
jgi:hypothetical protein